MNKVENRKKLCNKREQGNRKIIMRKLSESASILFHLKSIQN